METAFGALAAVMVFGLFVWLVDRHATREHAEHMAGRHPRGYLDYVRPTPKARWRSAPAVKNSHAKKRA